MGCCFLLLAYAFGHWPAYLIVLILGLTFFSASFGPGSTTFVLPTLYFPTLERATCHGVSAAMGKLGAVLGTATFMPIQHALGMPAAMLCGCAFAWTGCIVTQLFTPRLPVATSKSKNQIGI